MLLYPSLQEARAIAQMGDYRRVPVCTELYADTLTPIQALRILKTAGKHCFLFESAERVQRWGRYSFLGCAPVLEVTCKNGVTRVRHGGTVTETRGAPAEVLRAILRKHRAPRLPGLPPFAGGLVGYFSYDYIQYAEPSLQLHAADTDSFKDADLMLFEEIVAFDHYRQKIVLIANLDTADLERSVRQTEERLGALAALLTTGVPAPNPPLRLKSGFTPLFGRQEYCAMVEAGKRYIREGDIFQVVLSNRLAAEMEGSLLDAYRVLRTTNPSPYMFYFSSDDIEIAGASPETLVRLEDGIAHTFPLAGTRPRGKTPEEDTALERALLADEKERAEHTMLVDLGRNDLGRVSVPGTVEVERYMSVERFSHVMHLGSTVKGRLRPELDALDAVAAVLPAGTLSGAPKIRAAQIIDELENCKRGLYGGAVGYLDLSGNLDTCIGIRLAYAKNGSVCVRSGAGIVADSVPENEYVECESKARAVLAALETANGGLERPDSGDRAGTSRGGASAGKEAASV